MHGNVVEAVVVYADDERSFGFSPVMPILSRSNRTTQISYLVLPGHHATLVGNAFSVALTQAMRRIENEGNFNHHSLKTYLLAFHQFLAGNAVTPEEGFQTLQKLKPSAIRKSFLEVLGPSEPQRENINPINYNYYWHLIR